MSASETLVATPDDDWWKAVFTDKEYTTLEARFAQILAEHEVSRTKLSEPLDIVVLIAPEKFVEQLKILAMANRDGYEVEDIGVAFAQEYFENDDIEQDSDASLAAREFYSPWDDDDEEDGSHA